MTNEEMYAIDGGGLLGAFVFGVVGCCGAKDLTPGEFISLFFGSAASGALGGAGIGSAPFLP